MNILRYASIVAISMTAQACVTATSELPRPASDEEAARANLNLGAAYVRQGDLELALEKLERAIDLNSRLPEAHSTIAVVYDQLGETDLAERHYRRATQLQPGSADVHNGYAVFLCRQGRWSDAEPHFERAANNTRNTGPEIALTNAGQCAWSAGNVEAAEQYFRAALDRNPRYLDALISMLEIEYRRDNYLQARAFMQRAFEIREPDARQLLMCFNIEQALENADDASQCREDLRANFPRSTELAQLRELERDGGQ